MINIYIFIYNRLYLLMLHTHEPQHARLRKHFKIYLENLSNELAATNMYTLAGTSGVNCFFFFLDCLRCAWVTSACCPKRRCMWFAITRSTPGTRLTSTLISPMQRYEACNDISACVYGACVRAFMCALCVRSCCVCLLVRVCCLLFLCSQFILFVHRTRACWSGCASSRSAISTPRAMTPSTR